MQSPPSPFIIGSVTLTIAAIAIAASAALPPTFRMSRPTSAASGWLEQAMPVFAKTGARLALNGRMLLQALCLVRCFRPRLETTGSRRLTRARAAQCHVVF